MAQRSGSTCPQAVATAIEPALAGLGLDLYDVELVGGGRARTLRVFVDRDGGVDLETIAQATQAVSALLDTPAVAAALPGPYTLEVSSPGLERPLRTPAHFRSAWGGEISLKTRGDDGQPVRRRVRLDAADENGITVDVDGTVEQIAYDEVLGARTVFEWGPAQRPGPGRGRRAGRRDRQAVARS